LFQELWDTNNIWGSGRRQGSRVEQVMWVPFPASRNRDESSAANKQSKQQQQTYIPLSSGGQAFYMRGPVAPRLHSIILHHSGSGIHSLACHYSYSYSSGDGAAASSNGIRTAGPWGRHQSIELHRATVFYFTITN